MEQYWNYIKQNVIEKIKAYPIALKSALSEQKLSTK